MTGSAPPLVLVESLGHRYADGAEALRGVSLRIEAGERVALLGANGAGKSTLVLRLLGVLGGGGDGDGRVEVCGLAVSRANLAAIRRRVGLVFQDPDDQLFCPTVFEDIAFGPRNLGLAEDEVARRSAEALAAVGLAGVERRSPFHLSLGERKRAAIATVLATEPELLIFDEPTANLDPRGRRTIGELIRRLGRTQIIVTHDLELAAAACERAIVLSAGRVAADGPAARILSDSSLLDSTGLA